MTKKKLKLKKRVLYQLIFSIIICILFFSSYFIYTKSRKIAYYSNKNNSYSYLEIEEMSDRFADLGDKELHFVRAKKKIYVIAISKQKTKKYQNIINYTYGKTKKGKTMKVYGYPLKKNNKIKKLEMKYINYFLPYEERININNHNYNQYLFNTYLDTTINPLYQFNYIVFLLLLLFVIVLFIFIKMMFFKGSEDREKVQKKI